MVSNFSNGETKLGDLKQFDQGGNVSQTVSPNQTVPQLPTAPQFQKRQTINAARAQRNQAQALQNMFMDVVAQFPMFVENEDSKPHLHYDGA